MNFSLAVSRVGRLYLLDLTRFFDNQGGGGTVEKFEKYISSFLRVAVSSVFSPWLYIISYHRRGDARVGYEMTDGCIVRFRFVSVRSHFK